MFSSRIRHTKKNMWRFASRRLMSSNTTGTSSVLSHTLNPNHADKKPRGIDAVGEVIQAVLPNGPNTHNKTIKVRVERVKFHPVVCKPVRHHKHFLVHDELGQAIVGDIVKIHALDKKISKHKNFALGEIMKAAPRID